ncbi:MAG: TetR/AcrR family transcriptional regulator [Leptospirales bacterium]|nr:TetR/AcrR family transcriptional regulator [Leptospirales bacterium]
MVRSPALRDGPRERILRKAAELFSRQGYSRTGINQILEESGAHKASLYRYFETKEELALAYLQLQDQNFRSFLRLVVSKSKGPGHFVRVWSGLLWREARGGAYHGCPVANLRAQIEEEQERLRSAVASAIQSWLSILEEYFELERNAGRLKVSSSSAELAARLLRLYEGALQLFRMTGDRQHLRALETDLLLALQG